MDLIEGFLESIQTGPARGPYPSVTLSYAQSLDGSIAARAGAPLAISCRESLTVTHRLRAAHDAILVGIGTLLADDPRLNVRLVAGEDPQPVVLDGKLRTPLTARLMQAQKKPWIAAGSAADICRREALEAAGARLLTLPLAARGRLSLEALLAALGQSGVRSLMVEGGSRVLSAFLEAGLADRAVITVAPRFVGGLNVYSASQEGVHPSLALEGVGRFGDDIIVWGNFNKT